MKIGLFGGSFDPPHCGHVALATAALAHLALDELRWLPAGLPWQRQHRLASAEHRAAMVQAAIAGHPGFSLDRRELERSGPSYTIDTVHEWRAEHPQAELFLLLGEDQLQRLPTWHRWQSLIGEITLAVAGRGAVRSPPAELQMLPLRIERLPMPPMPVSSTAIRAHLAAGHSAQSLVPDVVSAGVARYIDRIVSMRSLPPEEPAAHSSNDHGEHPPRMDIRKLQRAIVDGLEDVKAQDIQVFNTEHLSPLFERVIVASGTSNRQTKSLAASVRDSVRTKGFSVMRTEGEENGEWIIVDCGAAVVHVMQPAIRQYYHLEELWGGKVVKMKFGDVKLGLVKAAEPDKPKRASSPAAPKRASSQAAPKRASPRAATQRAPVKTAARKSTSPSPTRSAPKPAASTRAASPSRAPARKAAGAALPSSKRASAPSAARAPARTAVIKSAPRAAGSGVVSRPTAKKSAPAKKTTRRA